MICSILGRMQPNLTPDEVAEQNMAFHQDDEDVFIVEDIGDSVDVQQGEPIMMLEPKKGLMFDSEDDAVRFYKGYAKKKGFGVVRRTARHDEDNKLNYFTLACSRQGKAQYSSKNSFKPNPSTRMQCPAKSNFSRRGDKFCITSVTVDHNHPISPSKARFLRCHKKLDLHAKRMLELNDQAGIRMNKNFGSLVIQAGGYDKLEFGEKECRNYLQETRRLQLGAGDAHAVYQYFLRMQSKDPDFFHVMEVCMDLHPFLNHVEAARGRLRGKRRPAQLQGCQRSNGLPASRLREHPMNFASDELNYRAILAWSLAESHLEDSVQAVAKG